ncbi:WecB/TagA/CpsF family glycosyltransferase [Luteococcus peritonei]|uniref:WecB/TagA/CpsF family glycosyltransferase n=1 Tax=Luteococcus peritonei TaxID=88874 RepID=A0ABW4RSF0_9ACTN
MHTRTSPDAELQTVDVDGIPLHVLTQQETVQQVMHELDQGRGGLLLTANVDIMYRLRMPRHRDVLDGSTLIVADGMPVVWASRLQGTPLPERVTGADLVWDLSREAARRGRTVFLLGAAPGVAERAGVEFERQFPGLEVVGHDAPPKGFEQDPAYMADLVARMQQLSPDLCYVALGFPKQERVALMLRESLPKTWFMGCGAALDMAAGEVRRAHPKLQDLGAEWAFRLLQEPRRLGRRYLLDDIPYAVSLVGRAGLKRLRAARG